MKAIGELTIDETYAISGTQPWRIKTPNGMNATGITIQGTKIKNAVNENQEPEVLDFMFLGCKWAIKVGFQIISFAVQAGILNFLKK